MSIIGISPGGDLVTSEGSAVQDRMEIQCEDPRFLELAERKRPNAVTAFVGGTWSYLRDWGWGVNYCLMLMGIYGSYNQQKAQRWRNAFKDIRNFAFAQPELAYRIISLKLRHTYSHAAFFGRVTGSGLLNVLMLTGGRYGQAILSGRAITVSSAVQRSSALRPSNYTNGAMKTNAPVMGANMVLAITGSSILAIKNGSADIGGIFSAILLGEYDTDPSGDIYLELFNQAKLLQNPGEIDPGEIEAMLSMLDVVEQCLDSPSSFGGAGREPVRPMVPVGSVSSARPPGVMGLIERGHEYNALDAISEANQYRLGSGG